MTGKLLLLWLPAAILVGIAAWLNASWQALINLSLAVLLAIVTGAFAFVLVRVVPPIWVRTGADGWIERHTGYDTRLWVALAVARTTRSWFLWLVMGAFWEVVITPPAAFLLFYALFFPSGPYRSNAGSIVVLGIACSYAMYGLCSYAFWEAARKATAART